SCPHRVCRSGLLSCDDPLRRRVATQITARHLLQAALKPRAHGNCNRSNCRLRSRIRCSRVGFAPTPPSGERATRVFEVLVAFSREPEHVVRSTVIGVRLLRQKNLITIADKMSVAAHHPNHVAGDVVVLKCPSAGHNRAHGIHPVALERSRTLSTSLAVYPVTEKLIRESRAAQNLPK